MADPTVPAKPMVLKAPVFPAIVTLLADPIFPVTPTLLADLTAAGVRTVPTAPAVPVNQMARAKKAKPARRILPANQTVSPVPKGPVKRTLLPKGKSDLKRRGRPNQIVPEEQTELVGQNLSADQTATPEPCEPAKPKDPVLDFFSDPTNPRRLATHAIYGCTFSPSCTSTFDNFDALRQHHRREHTPDFDLYVCPQSWCWVAFKSCDGLKAHWAASHAAAHPGFRFSALSRLFGPGRGQWYWCGFCKSDRARDPRLEWLDDLERHLREHYEGTFVLSKGYKALREMWRHLPPSEQ